MSFPAYPTYKDSGVAWLGKIPSEWRVVRLRELIRLTNGYPFDAAKFSSEAGHPLVRIRDLNATEAAVHYDGEIVESALVDGNDLLIGMDGDFNVGRWRGEGAALLNQRVCCLRGDQNILRLLELSLIEPLKQINDLTYSTTVKHLSSSQVLDIRFALPNNADDLNGLAAFLDRETAKIDALVAEQERLIALLREKRQAVISHAVTKGLNPDALMKDSGVEWLGEIPAHWEVRKLTQVSRLESGHTPSRQRPEYWVEGECVIPWFTLADVGQLRSGRSLTIKETSQNISQIGLENSAARLLPAGTVILSRTASVGFPGITDIDLAVSQDFAAWICSVALKADFLLLVLLAMRSEFSRLMMGSTHQTIYMPDIEAFKVPLPPVEEQLEIASCVTEQLQRFDELIDASQKAIALASERRAALISAAVTGKIDVRAQAPQSNVISIDSARPSNLPPLRAVVGAYAIHTLPSMGRMPVMKVGYLAEAHARFCDLKGQYERNAAGPYDKNLIEAMQDGAWNSYGIKTCEPKEKGKPVTYILPTYFQPPYGDLHTLVGEDQAKSFLAMLSLLKGIDSRDGVEAVATLYAVWNDLIADCKAADDDAICDGVFGWHPEKPDKFRRADLDRWLAWMRRNGLVPDGSAPRTDSQGRLFT